ncbi:unnamed protein product [Fusarium graminearum]|nr:unnamed protein product [Fusarium graminearum]VTO92900.1 unnamed protein product [Fusarium graminearum]
MYDCWDESPVVSLGVEKDSEVVGVAGCRPEKSIGEKGDIDVASEEVASEEVASEEVNSLGPRLSSANSPISTSVIVRVSRVGNTFGYRILRSNSIAELAQVPARLEVNGLKGDEAPTVPESIDCKKSDTEPLPRKFSRIAATFSSGAVLNSSSASKRSLEPLRSSSIFSCVTSARYIHFCRRLEHAEHVGLRPSHYKSTKEKDVTPG